MALIDKQLHKVWDALRAQNTQRSRTLLEVRIQNLRGIRDLRVPFDYPVSVLAGPNACGKSTVLFSCACAYRVPGHEREFAPSSLFPNFTSSRTGLVDKPEQTKFEFYYLHDNERRSMVWRRGKAWSRSYMGRRGGEQPVRQVYLRTLANLTSPSEVRSLLQLSRKDFQSEQITEDLLIFARRILPRRYRNLSMISAQVKTLLFAELEGASNTSYSEFHMSAGERAILRISKDISNLSDALVLIDEVEAGLHPYTQQQAMLELQRIALRNKLQIVVTSHSPVVLESVPSEARLFLDRDEDTSEVRRVQPYRDILQKALYGQSQDKLSILCEDQMAEGLLLGFLDVLNPKLGIRHDDITIGRDTGQREFPGHVRTLAKFNKLRDFLFVLDGDARRVESDIKRAASDYDQTVQPLFLPGDGPPEAWIWQILTSNSNRYATQLGVSATAMEERIHHINRLLSGTLQQQNYPKIAVEEFASELDRTTTDIARIVGRCEAEDKHGDVVPLLVAIEETINLWRQE